MKSNSKISIDGGETSGVRTADRSACGPWSADFSADADYPRTWWLEPFADADRPRIKTTIATLAATLHRLHNVDAVKHPTEHDMRASERSSGVRRGSGG